MGAGYYIFLSLCGCLSHIKLINPTDQRPQRSRKNKSYALAYGHVDDSYLGIDGHAYPALWLSWSSPWHAAYYLNGRRGCCLGQAFHRIFFLGKYSRASDGSRSSGSRLPRASVGPSAYAPLFYIHRTFGCYTVWNYRLESGA